MEELLRTLYEYKLNVTFNRLVDNMRCAHPPTHSITHSHTNMCCADLDQKPARLQAAKNGAATASAPL